MAGGAIAAAVIGATATAVSTAASMAQNAIKNSKSNLACSIEVWNGTAYDFNVVKTAFRKGALLGGTEGTFIESPGILGQQSFCVFSVEQIAGATTDVIGAVLFRSKVIDLLVGFHIYDQAGFQRYITAVPLNRGAGDSLFDEKWDAFNIDKGLNKYIWSGAGRKNTYTTKNTAYKMSDFEGNFIRDIRERDKQGDLVATIQGNPSIRQIDASGQPSFATLYTGGGQIMKAIVSDDAFIDEIVDITGPWQDEKEPQTRLDVTFISEGIKITNNNTPTQYTRDSKESNRYKDIATGDVLVFEAKQANRFNQKDEKISTLHRYSGVLAQT